MAIISSQQGLGSNPEFVQVCRGGCSTLNPQFFIRAPVSFERQHEEKEAMPFLPRTPEGRVVPSLLWVPPRPWAPKAQITVGRLGPVPLPARFRGSVPDSHGLPVPELVLYPTLPNELAL